MAKKLLVGLLATVSLLAAGCGVDDGADPVDPTSTSAAPTSDTPTSEASSDGTSDSPEDEQVSIQGVSLTLPDDWAVDEKDDSRLGASLKGSAGLTRLTVLSIVDPGEPGTTAEGRDLFVSVAGYSPPPEVLDDVEIDGRPAWHVSATVGDDNGIINAFGLDTDAYTVSLEFTFSRRDVPEGDRDALIAQFLDSVSFD